MRGNKSGYMRYVQGIQPNVPAHTTFMDIYRQSSVKIPPIQNSSSNSNYQLLAVV